MGLINQTRVTSWLSTDWWLKRKHQEEVSGEQEPCPPKDTVRMKWWQSTLLGSCYTNLRGVVPDRWRGAAASGGGRGGGVVPEPLGHHHARRVAYAFRIPHRRGPYHVVRMMHAGICLRMMTVAWQHWGICGSRKSIAGGPGVRGAVAGTI